MAKDSKKKPGRKPWYHDEDGKRLEFLRNNVEEFGQCEKAKGDAVGRFYTAVTLKFLLKFGTGDRDSSSVGDTSASQTNQPVLDQSASLNPEQAQSSTDAPDSRTDLPLPITDSSFVSGDTSTSQTNQPILDQSASLNPEQVQSSADAPDSRTGLPFPITPDDSCSQMEPVQSIESNSWIGTNSIITLDNPTKESDVVGVASTTSNKGLDTVSFSDAAKQLGWTGLSLEQLEEKRNIFLSYRTKISEWYRQNRRMITNANNSLLKQVFDPKKPSRKPQRTGVVQVFMDLHFDTYIKEEALKELKEAEAAYAAWVEGGKEGDEVKKPVAVAIRSKVAKHILEAQSEDFKATVQKVADERYEEEIQQWEEQKSGIQSEKKKTPEDYQRALQSRGPEVAKFTSAVSEDTGMVVVFGLVGPNPMKGGQIDTYWTHAGKTSLGWLWPQADPAGYEATKQSLIKFGKRVYNSEARVARALVNTPVVAPSGFNNGIPAPPSGQHSQGPGPGRDSSGARKGKSKGQKGKPTSAEPSTGTDGTDAGPATPATNTTATAAVAEPSLVPACDPPAAVSSPTTTPAHVPLNPTSTDPLTGSCNLPPTSDATGAITLKEPVISTNGEGNGNSSGRDEMEVDQPTVWTHPDRSRFWTEMRSHLEEWGEAVKEWGASPWRETLEGLLEVFIEYEGEFYYTEDHGKLESKKELKLVKKWEKAGRPAFLIIKEPLEMAGLMMSDLRAWWEDVLPDREGDNEDWAPFDCVSGKQGVWKFICGLTWVLFFVRGEEVEALTDEQSTCLADWMVLTMEVKDTLIKVIEHGVNLPKKRKSPPESDEQTGRVTRARFAKMAERSVSNGVDGTKSKSKTRRK
ncbi:hypothetical protein VKT23_020245 [Stygiomarasmius scandens]|uniref:Uncharacterized protein n=1 Tax=Marasmiellus scandens TaxID=2682957 RepID=A0ABR1IJG8_9AGAR